MKVSSCWHNNIIFAGHRACQVECKLTVMFRRSSISLDGQRSVLGESFNLSYNHLRKNYADCEEEMKIRGRAAQRAP